MPRPVEKELDRLYSLPPREFTAARRELVKAYREADDREAAERTNQARKPTLAAWTVNQLVRREEGGVAALLEAGKHLRSAQRKALRGGSAETLREASDEERRALRELLDAAKRVLEDEGQHPTPATLEQVERTLHAAARDESSAELLSRGRLTHELDPTGFGSFSAADLRQVDSGRRSTRPGSKRQAGRLELRRAELRGAVRDLRKAVEQAERDLHEAERTARAKANGLEAARRRLARAEAQLDELETGS